MADALPKSAPYNELPGYYKLSEQNCLSPQTIGREGPKNGGREGGKKGGSPRTKIEQPFCSSLFHQNIIFPNDTIISLK